MAARERRSACAGPPPARRARPRTRSGSARRPRRGSGSAASRRAARPRRAGRARLARPRGRRGRDRRPRNSSVPSRRPRSRCSSPAGQIAITPAIAVAGRGAVDGDEAAHARPAHADPPAVDAVVCGRGSGPSGRRRRAPRPTSRRRTRRGRAGRRRAPPSPRPRRRGRSRRGSPSASPRRGRSPSPATGAASIGQPEPGRGGPRARRSPRAGRGPARRVPSHGIMTGSMHAGDASEPGRGLGRLPARQPGQRSRPPRGRRLRRRRARARVRHARLRLRRGRHPRPRARRTWRPSAPRNDDFEVIYASKAAPFTAAYRVLREEGLSVDVASGGELHMALRAGFDPARIHMHGNNKTEAELRRAVDAGVGHVICDSLAEIERLDAICAAAGRRQEVLIRVTPGVKADTHSYIQTGQLDSKFGLGLADGLAARAIEAVRGSRTSSLVGLHAHIGSQIFELEPYVRAIEALARARRPGRGAGCSTSAAGSGSRTRRDDDPPSIDAYVEVKVDGVERVLRPAAADPGRARPLAGRQRRDHRLHGRHGEGDSRRAHLRRRRRRHVRQPAPDALRRRATRRSSPTAPTTPADTTVTIAGMHCESSDMLVRDAQARGAPARRRPRHPGDRRLRLRDGQQLQRRPAPAGDLLPRRRRAPRRPPRDLRGPDRPRCQ